MQAEGARVDCESLSGCSYFSWTQLTSACCKFQFLGGSEDAFVREISFVDPSNRSVTTTSVNLSLSQFATCYERIRYLPSPSNPFTQTVFQQTAEIQSRVGLWRSMSDTLETWLAERFKQNAQRGQMGFTDVLRTLWEKEDQNVHSTS